MKKLFKGLASVLATFVLLVSLASCSKISQSYADKINKAAKDGEPLTASEVKEALGEDAFEVNIIVGSVIVAVKDCDDLEDLEEKWEDGKTVKGIIVTTVLGKATSATYGEINPEDLGK